MLQQVLTPVYQKKKELEAEIAALAQKRDIEKRRCDEAVEAADAVHKRLKDLESTIELVGKHGEEIVGNLSRIIDEAKLTVDSSVAVIDNTMNILNKLDGEINVKIASVKKLDGEEKARIQKINLENDKLDVRRRDLQIYFDRLQKRFDEHGLGKLIL